MEYIKIFDEGSSYEAKRFFKDKECKILHREDGPAIEHKDGSEQWFVNGKRHREDGPAIKFIWIGSVVEYYYLNDNMYSKKEYLAIIKFGSFI